MQLALHAIRVPVMLKKSGSDAPIHRIHDPMSLEMHMADERVRAAVSRPPSASGARSGFMFVYLSSHFSSTSGAVRERANGFGFRTSTCTRTSRSWWCASPAEPDSHSLPLAVGQALPALPSSDLRRLLWNGNSCHVPEGLLRLRHCPAHVLLLEVRSQGLHPFAL